MADSEEDGGAGVHDEDSKAGHGAVVNRTIKKRLWRILDKAAEENRAVDLQDLLLRLMFDNICGLTSGKTQKRFHLSYRDVNGDQFPTSVLQRIALNFVLAGRDTSSVALSWFFWLVMNQPEIEKKIISEISSVLREIRGYDQQKWHEEPLDFDEADRLVYLKAALAETLRLYPSAPEDFNGENEDYIGGGLHGIQAGAVAVTGGREVRGTKRWVYVCGVQCGTEDLLGEGLGLPSNEVCGVGGAAALPAVTGSRPPCGAEDVPDSVHEERPSLPTQTIADLTNSIPFLRQSGS
ncbi:hypothetical protein SLEP1_g6911 [Rubroshorea leprosula]|uniref:Cytochrome P450 n=1 Tax=Rubroshorea leprosula TaxID=152421 RepID=A0AAV5I6P2_9ROSI|nr:hypothetical protein SLEP1_g6911 [Rubroshorea leprosula]